MQNLLHKGVSKTQNTMQNANYKSKHQKDNNDNKRI